MILCFELNILDDLKFLRVSFVFLRTYTSPYSLVSFICYKPIIFHSIYSGYLAMCLIFSFPVYYLINYLAASNVMWNNAEVVGYLGIITMVAR